MPSCFFWCNSGYNGGKTHLFRAPKNCDKELKNIHKRRDSNFDFKKSVVCKETLNFKQTFCHPLLKLINVIS